MVEFYIFKKNIIQSFFVAQNLIKKGSRNIYIFFNIKLYDFEVNFLVLRN